MATVAEQELKLHVSPSINELAIDHFAEKQRGNDKPEPDLEHVALSGAMKVAREEAHALVALAETVYGDGSQTPAAAAIQVASAARKSGERVAARLLAAQEKVDTTIASLEKVTFAPPPDATIGERYDQEIRASLKALTPDELAKEINDALVSNDMALIGAVLRAPRVTTGMKAAELESLRHRFRTQHFPGEMRRLERLKKMRAASDVGGGAFIKLVQQAGDTTFANAAIAARSKREAVLSAHQQQEA
ncbi:MULTISPECIES: hypothetical protein [unclassified Mesorhizobium]|uniref:hypothetical protein n=1 Tax=unclassified Mesorhizobium TaxID=325217 RepID=UPI000FCCB037|nr:MULTISPECIES: hypothetical protein [unclassified Mesorhizobium]RUT84831.1 hypothetical protein EOD14_19555 [Mesorhizobium sp. M7A.T.Ca.US.000.02.1.1]RUT94657.1 hypothetical protein EOD15_00990 [Mesorhizobium sp. M7A.T.Ca.US.000.02.2.1]RUU03654.1 hypothetical protein EOD12_09545 [Mesorhizobium sp. M7A.T.Ca.TU.009.02.1.1]RUU88452.1 hypothetical protein EOD03_04795 [Mesorhizobium sp. M7A.T.Ca.TU.009.01.1.2]